jgi:hypothetical protein
MMGRVETGVQCVGGYAGIGCWDAIRCPFDNLICDRDRTERLGDRVAGVVRRRRFGSLRGSGGIRRILSTGESAGRSRRVQAR